MSLFLHRFLGALFAGAMAACGGTDGDAPEQTEPEVARLAGIGYVGESSLGEQVARGEVYVKGSSGIMRRVVMTTRPFTYEAVLDQLGAPYVAKLDIDGNSLLTVATSAGQANITPLTALVVAELTGRPPNAYFAALASFGDATLNGITEEAVAAAQLRVRRYLQRSLGLDAANDVGDFITTPFSVAAGDPMFELIEALNAELLRRDTNIIALAGEVAERATLCQAERVTLTVAGEAQDFCPRSKSADPDEGDGSIVNYRFTDSDGAVLAFAARGAAVLRASLSDTAGSVFACSGAGCAGLALGSPAGDLSRPVVINALSLSGPTGRVVLDGALVTSVPGVSLPPLACENKYYVIYPDRTVKGTCAAPDPFFAIGAGSVSDVGGRRSYVFSTDGAVDPAPPTIFLRADGEQIVSVTVGDTDADTGVRTLYRCLGTACNGVTIGSATDDPNFSPPFILRLRPIALERTVLTAVNADGTPSETAATITVQGTFDSVEIFDPSAQLRPCASPAQRLSVKPSDQAEALALCPSAESSGNPGTVVDGESVAIQIASDYSSDSGLFPALNAFIVATGGEVVSVEVIAEGGLYRCAESACGGITVSAPNGAGERSVSFSGAVLGEVSDLALPGDRTVTIDGSFVAPPP